MSTFFIGFCIVCGMVIAARGDGGGGRIAFTSLRDGAQWEIYVMAGDGSHPVNVINHAAADGAPAWSPSGTRIAFMSNRTGNSDTYAMGADGSDPVNVTNHAAEDGFPSWSPDGRRIAFTSNRDGNTEIYVMNADGS